MAQLTIADTIENGDICTFLAANSKAKTALFPNRLVSTNPVTIGIVTDALRWQYELYPSDSTLRGVANYLYWLTANFNLQAKYIMTGSGGGTVIPSGGAGYIYTELTVTIASNSSTYGNAQLIGGKDLSFVILNNQLLTTANGDFTFNSVTGTLTFINVSLFTGDLLTIPYNKKL